MQKPSNVEKALTHSWADYTGVNLKDNPDLGMNKHKFIQKKDGVKDSDVPDKMY